MFAASSFVFTCGLILFWTLGKKYFPAVLILKKKIFQADGLLKMCGKVGHSLFAASSFVYHLYTRLEWILFSVSIGAILLTCWTNGFRWCPSIGGDLTLSMEDLSNWTRPSITCPLTMERRPRNKIMLAIMAFTLKEDFQRIKQVISSTLENSPCFCCSTETNWPTGCPVHLISEHTLHCVQRPSHLIYMHTMWTQCEPIKIWLQFIASELTLIGYPKKLFLLFLFWKINFT